MSDRRSGPPLFDLMRERGQRPDAPKPRPQTPAPAHKASPEEDQPPPKPQPGVAPPAPRQTAWDSSGGVSRAERSAAAMLDEEVQTDSGIVLSTTRFYTLIAVALVLIVAAWAGGYKIGFGDGKDEMSRFMGDQPIVSPRQANTAPDSRSSQPPRDDQARAQTSPQTSTQTSPPTSAPDNTAASARPGSAIMTPEGFLTRDPREAGMNYLMLATLPAEQAADAISFMKANGVTIIGVPKLDSGRASANNPSRYTLYSLGLAIPGNQWSSMSAQRRDHQQMIANLGARWQRERRGGSDFSQTLWEKYEP